MSFEGLEDVLAAVERRAEEIRAEGGLKAISALRQFDPGDRVAARLEVSTGGWLRGTDAGIDVMGDGSLVPYSGGIRRRELEPLPGEPAIETLRRQLQG